TRRKRCPERNATRTSDAGTTSSRSGTSSSSWPSACRYSFVGTWRATVARPSVASGSVRRRPVASLVSVALRCLLCGLAWHVILRRVHELSWFVASRGAGGGAWAQASPLFFFSHASVASFSVLSLGVKGDRPAGGIRGEPR